MSNSLQYKKKTKLMSLTSVEKIIGNQDNRNSRYDRLRRAVTELMDSASVDGGFIFGTINRLHGGMSPDHVHFMYRLTSELDRVSTAKSQ